MICLLAADIADGQEYAAMHPSLPPYAIVTPENAYVQLFNHEYSRIVYTDRFLKVKNQNEIYIQARSVCKRSVASSRRRVANSSKG